MFSIVKIGVLRKNLLKELFQKEKLSLIKLRFGTEKIYLMLFEKLIVRSNLGKKLELLEELELVKLRSSILCWESHRYQADR